MTSVSVLTPRQTTTLALSKKVITYVTRAIFNVTHNSFALLGIAVVFLMLGLVTQPQLVDAGEEHLRGWLQARQVEAIGMEIDVDATDRATAVDPKELPKQQAALAFWLSKKYRVAPEPISALVAEAYEVGKTARLEPTLILAIMAIESGFNPFAQSAVGAQGLMQVMTSAHTDKYAYFGGKFAAFDPVTNLRVGVKVLQDCIARAGNLEGGLKHYVGATGPDDGGYANKVLTEQQRLMDVTQGKQVPHHNAASVPANLPASGKGQSPVSPTPVNDKIAALTQRG
jgi:Transglycosylase SLT domain